MAFTLHDLEVVFDRLGADGQIQLIEHLARMMQHSDGIDTRACAADYAGAVCRFDATDAEIERVIEGVLYPTVLHPGSATKPIMEAGAAIAVKLSRDITIIQNIRPGGFSQGLAA